MQQFPYSGENTQSRFVCLLCISTGAQLTWTYYVWCQMDIIWLVLSVIINHQSLIVIASLIFNGILPTWIFEQFTLFPYVSYFWLHCVISYTLMCLYRWSYLYIQQYTISKQNFVLFVKKKIYCAIICRDVDEIFWIFVLQKTGNFV